MQDYNDTRSEQEPRRLGALHLRLALGILLGGVTALGPILPARAHTGEPKSAAFIAVNSDGGEEAAAAGAGAGPLPLTDSAAGQPPEPTQPITETLRMTDTVNFLPLHITTNFTGTIEANGKVTRLAAGTVLTSTKEGITFKDNKLQIPLPGDRVAVIPVPSNELYKAVTIDVDGTPREFTISPELRPIGTATVTADVLNVRISESANAPILGQLKKGDPLTVLKVITSTNGTLEKTDDAVRFQIAFDNDNEDGSVSDGFVASKIGTGTFTTPFIANPIPPEGLGGTGGPVSQEKTNWLTNFANWWNDVKTFFGWSDEEVTVVTAADGVTPIAVTNEDGKIVATITPAATPGEFVVTQVVEEEAKSEPTNAPATVQPAVIASPTAVAGTAQNEAAATVVSTENPAPFDLGPKENWPLLVDGNKTVYPGEILLIPQNQDENGNGIEDMRSFVMYGVIAGTRTITWGNWQLVIIDVAVDSNRTISLSHWIEQKLPDGKIQPALNFLAYNATLGKSYSLSSGSMQPTYVWQTAPDLQNQVQADKYAAKKQLAENLFKPGDRIVAEVMFENEAYATDNSGVAGEDLRDQFIQEASKGIFTGIDGVTNPQNAGSIAGQLMRAFLPPQ